MRRFIFSFLALVTVGMAFGLVTRADTFVFPKFVNLFYYSACNKPITYKIGIVDERFHLSRNAFFNDVQQAALIWSLVEGKNLFEYDQKALLTINLVFDQRQSLNDQITQLEEQLKTGKSSIDPQIAQYETLALEFKQKLETLNNQISFWNNKGGAPQDEYEKLKKEQEDLKAQADRLNALSHSLNLSTNLYNAQVGTLNQTVETLQQALQVKPEEGIYDPKENKIDIYFNINQQELLHTLAHELGHALSLQHVSNPKAIMYAFSTQEISPTNEDIAMVKKVCEKHNIFKLTFERLIQSFYNPSP